MIEDKIRDVVKQFKPYVPGKSKEEIVRKYGINPEEIIKLGSNENPWGPSPKIKEEILKEVPKLHQYPEPVSPELLEELSKFLDVPKENIIVGGDGADEIIDTIMRTFIDEGDEVIIPIPTFTQYAISTKIYGANIRWAKFDKERDFQLDVDSVLSNINERTKVIFLCTPNNPTGNIIDKKDVEKIINSTDALVVIDHAYIEYSKKEYDLTKWALKYDNVLVLRTFSKVFGLAGQRIGYGITNEKIINYMMRVKPVFSLTRLSQICAITALRDREFFERCVRDGIKSREMLYEGLKKFKDIRVYPSEANYLLVELKTMISKEFCEELLKRGVIVRDCSSFDGLGDNYVRISIGTFEENERFLKILEEIIK
ncbi:histidinol-phosphate transaminase [Methanotorris formicicus]|uniref:Histidinol-phosphate aminotransferase n=1 Tax=Methanotorris formicicus Mc-S-70 TaxID=647171 RepID=H1KWQ3_9EURY|nr:histidinol-phosphate transaminase [Methanotorris formicicus]EHP89168.1 histidinol-phosphate aminotransferase [Methanotorris formicicus Mc-S-70]